MNKFIHLISLLIFSLCFSFGGTAGNPSKQVVLSGFVKDSITNERLPFATIQIFHFSDSTLISGVMTDSKGNYRIEDISEDEFVVQASYMGYHAKTKHWQAQTNGHVCNFSLQQKSQTLSEVSVKAERNMLEKKLEKTIVNVSKDKTTTGGTAMDVMQTLPSVDVDIDGNLNYRGSDKVLILVNGEKSEIVRSLDQIPANQIESVELINNPSAKYDAEGMSGIINIVMKSGQSGQSNTSLMAHAGYPENFGGNIGYSGNTERLRFFVNAGMKHRTKYQTKAHFRDNYGNPDAYNYYQFDRQNQNLNDVFLNTSFDVKPTVNQVIGLSIVGSHTFNNADRDIAYETLSKADELLFEGNKAIDINLNNTLLDGSLKYKYTFKQSAFVSAKLKYSVFDQMQIMNNNYYTMLVETPAREKTYSQQLNKLGDFSLNYYQPIKDFLIVESGYVFRMRDLMNDFRYNRLSSLGLWVQDSSLSNQFTYLQIVQATYLNLSGKLKTFEYQAGLRAEYTEDYQNTISSGNDLHFFPSIHLSNKLNDKFSLFATYNQRINRPTIKMLNPFSDEYADLLNMHKGNPDLKPEYVNSLELGNRFVFKQLSGFTSLYYRDIDQAISRVKAASNDSALYVSFINLDQAKFYGAEISLSFKPFNWWTINSGTNLFYIELSGEHGNNNVYNNKFAWNSNLTNQFKLPEDIGIQIAAYYRSKLPSVMGIYDARYYLDFAVSKSLIDGNAQLIFKISDVFDTYIFGLDLDGIDDAGYAYSQTNRRKRESQYFILSFVYNINAKISDPKGQKANFYLDDFDK